MRAWMSPATFRSMYEPSPSNVRAKTRTTTATATMTSVVIAHMGTPPSAGTALTRDIANVSMGLTVNLRENDVEASDDRHDVGDHEPLRDRLEDVHGHEGTGADLEPVRVGGPVADDVDPRLAARALGADVRLAGGRLEHARDL